MMMMMMKSEFVLKLDDRIFMSRATHKQHNFSTQIFRTLTHFSSHCSGSEK